MVRIAICDDDNAICMQIEGILLELIKTLPEMIENEVFYSGETLCNHLSKGMYFDIIFLDIELSNINGVGVGKKIRNEMYNETTQIVYISSKENYAMELFDIRPLNFLVKPLKASKIEEVVRTALHLIDKENKFFEFRSGRTNKKVPIKDILYFESCAKKIKIITQTEIHVFYGKLSEVEQQLNYHDFILIHKSYLANYYHLIEYQYDYVKMTNKSVLSISQQNRKLIRNRLLQIRQRGKSYGFE